MRPLATILAIALLAVPAAGDIVHLKTGTSLEGQVIPTEDGVIIRLPVGEVRISKDAIARIEKKPSAMEEYQKRADALKKDDAEAHYKLGLWAQGAGLRPQARAHFLTAIGLDAKHAKAHQALGHRLVKGRWMTEEQEMQARGLVKYDGQWMTPDAAARLQALKAQLELAREKRMAAEAELNRTREQLKAGQERGQTALPTPAPDPYEGYYATRPRSSPRTYYYVPRYETYYYHAWPYYYPSYPSYYYSSYYQRYPSPSYSGLYGTWRFYPGGRRYIRRSHRYYMPRRHRHR